MLLKNRQLEIINAAGELLTHNGLSSFTIKNLAAKMGFAESALYRHFPNKESIIITMLEYISHHLENNYSENVVIENSAKQLRSFFEQQINFFEKNPHFLIAILSEGLIEQNDKIKRVIEEIMSLTKKHLLKIISAGQKEGIFTLAIPANDLVHIIMGSNRMLMLQWRMSFFSFSLKKRGQQLSNSILKLIEI